MNRFSLPPLIMRQEPLIETEVAPFVYQPTRSFGGPAVLNTASHLMNDRRVSHGLMRNQVRCAH